MDRLRSDLEPIGYSLGMPIRRRGFLVQGGRVAMGAGLAGGAADRLARAAIRESFDDLTRDLSEHIPRLMRELNVPGVSVAVIRDADIAWRGAFGVRDVEAQTAVDTDTIFEAASMSKPVFAYAVMKLCEKGVLSLERPLTEYGAPLFLAGDARLALITARHVLSHTTGFQNWRSDSKPLAIAFAPGSQYGYSGEGFSYLQSVVTHVTKQKIEPFMKANLLEPFGMKTSGYLWNETFAARGARPHSANGRPTPLRKRAEADVARYAAAGDLQATPTEYAKFLLETMRPTPADAFRLGEASRREMLRPQIKATAIKSRGLGWELVQTDQGVIVQHGGDNPGFRCFAAMSIEARFGMVVMTNGDSGGPLMGRFFSATLDRLRAL
jgi:CubicO group peptidase (beta-lactamase class C family)